MVIITIRHFLYLVDGKKFKCQVLYNNGMITTDIELGADGATALLYNLLKCSFLAYG